MASSSFQCFPRLRFRWFINHSLRVDTTIMVSNKCPMIGKYVNTIFVTKYVTVSTCSLIIWHFFDTITVASTPKRVVIITHQNQSLAKHWKLFGATFTYLLTHHHNCLVGMFLPNVVLSILTTGRITELNEKQPAQFQRCISLFPYVLTVPSREPK